MSSTPIIMAGLTAVIAVSLFVPLRRGAQISCNTDINHPNPPKRMLEVGLPFSFYSTVGSAKSFCVPQNAPFVDVTQPSLGHIISPASAWFDLMVDGAILLGANYALGLRKVTK